MKNAEKKLPETDVLHSPGDTPLVDAIVLHRQTPLCQKEERFSALINTIPGIIWEADPARISFSFVSRQAENLLGYPAQYWIDEPDFWINHLHPDDRTQAVDYCTRSANEKKSHHLEYRMISAHGQEVWLEDSITVIIENVGVTRLRGIMIDITARKTGQMISNRDESSIRKQNKQNLIVENFQDITQKASIEGKITAEKELSDSIINSLPGIFYLYDDTGKFIRWNKNFETVSGYTTEEIREMHPLDFYDEDEKQKVKDRIKNVFKKKMPGIEVIFFTRHKKKIPFYFNSYAITFEGKPCIIGMGVDISEQKKAAEQLRLNEQQLNLIYNTVSDIIFMLQIETKGRFKFVSVNNTFLETTGLHRTQVVGKYIEEVIPESSLQLVLRNYNEAIVNKKTVSWEETTTYPSGNKTGIVSVTPVLNESGKCIQLIGSMHDISESKLAKEALVKSNERFKYASKATSDAIWDWDTVSGELFWGDNFEILFGYPPADSKINYAIWHKNLHPEDTVRVSNTLKQVNSGAGNIWCEEYRFKKLNGDYAYVQDKGIIIRDEQGKALRMIGAMQDITRQKKEEQQLKLLESAITNTLESVVITEANPVTGHESSIVYVNDAFTRMTGYTKEEVFGKTLQFLRGPRTDSKELARLAKALANWQPCVIEMINYKKNGEEFWVNFEAVPVSDGAGKFSHWLSIQRDTTERKKLEVEKEILYRIIKAINDNDYLENGLVEVLEKICTYLNFNYGEVWLLNFDKTSMVYKVNWQPFSKSGIVKSMNHVNELKKGEGLAGMVFEKKKAIYPDDLQGRDFIKKEKTAAGLNSSVGLPVFFNGAVIAVFVFYAKEHFNNAQINSGLLNQVSNQLGAVIQKNRTEEELNRFFNLSPDMLCIAGIDGYLKKINQAFTKILGYSEQELLTTPFIAFIHPEDKFKPEQKKKTALSGNSPSHFLNRFFSKSGDIKWLEWTATTVPDEGLIFAVIKDVTEKTKMDEERKRILESISDCFYSLDKNFNYIYINKAAEKMLRAGHGDLIGKNIWEKYPGLLEDVFYEKVTEAISTRQPAHFEYFDKPLKSWFEQSVYPTEEGFSIFFRSINERKETLAALVDAYEEKATILESVTDGFYTIDKNWLVTYWNKMAEEIVGIKRADIVGKNIREIFVDGFGESSYNLYQEAMENNDSKHFEEFFPTLNTWLEISVYPSQLGLSVYFKDVTGRKRAQEKLNSVNQELAQKANALAESNSELERFAYVASHDLQEPLRMVSGFLKLLQKNYKDQLDDTANKYIHFAVNGAERMKSLITDLLEYSRINIENYEAEDTCMNTVVNEVQAILKDTIEELNAEILVGSLPVVPNSHKTELFQLMQNLVGNALKYHSNEKPLIKIAATEKEQYWQFSIEDNGIGIDPKFADKVFVIFQRLHSNNEYSGTGIGLSICKKIVEKHGGRIWVEPSEGNGSTFYFTIRKTG